LNPSDKTRGTTYSDDGGESKLKKYKWFILGGAIIVIVAVVLGVVLGTKKSGDGPGPNPSPTPIPHGPWSAFNPYTVSATHDYASKKIGSASAPLQTIQDLEANQKAG